jgi:hypothetical protein
MDNQPDLFTLVEAQSLNNEINRLKDLNQRLVAAAKELIAAPDVAEWDDACSKLSKIIIAEKNNGLRSE